MPRKNILEKRAYEREYRKNNLDLMRARDKRYYEKNKDSLKIRQKNFYDRQKLKVLTFYSDGKLVCACCGDNRYCFLTLDHIVPLKSHKRKFGGIMLCANLAKNKFPQGYQVLCYNCNCLKNKKEKCPCGTKFNL